MARNIFVFIWLCLITIAGCKKGERAAEHKKIPLTRSQKVSLPRISQPAARKRVMIFFSRGGGGHISVSNALREYLQPEYDVQLVNLFDDVLYSLDPIRSVTFDRYTGEDLYNFFLKNRMTWCANTLCMSFGSKRICDQAPQIERLLNAFIERSKPDLMISVIPLLNRSILRVAQRQKIPFLVVTNDLDTSNYINGFEGEPVTSPFLYTIPYDDPRIWDKIARAKFAPQQVVVCGFPLRPDFFVIKDAAKIRQDFKVPAGKPVVMVLMGGAGSESSYRYTKQIARQMTIPLHVIVCLGRNVDLDKKIKGIRKKNPAISIDTIGFTDRISDLMAISDILITKPGPGSISEAVAMRLPMLLDVTSDVLAWEELNVKFVEENKFGECVHRYRDIPELLTKYLCERQHYDRVKSHLCAFPQVRCCDSIRLLVRSLLNTSERRATVN